MPLHIIPASAAGTSTSPGANITAARRTGTSAFSGKTHAKTTNASWSTSASAKLVPAHHAASVRPPPKPHITMSLTVHSARHAMKAANVWCPRLRGAATKT